MSEKDQERWKEEQAFRARECMCGHRRDDHGFHYDSRCTMGGCRCHRYVAAV